MTSLAQPARVLVDPIDGMGAAIEARRWVWPLVMLCLCVSLSGVSFALRWNAAPAVIQKLQMTGELTRYSESEVADEIQTTSRKALVGGIAKGVFVMPLQVLLLAAVLWLTAWLFGAPAAFGRMMAVAAIAMLPIALFHLIFAACASAQYSLSETQVESLVPSSLAMLEGLSPKLRGALKAVDFFNLWSVGLMALGFSSATGMRRGRALLLAVVLYAMFVGVFLIGLPGIMAGMAGGPGMGGGK
ncbi:YIP1 family protein [Hyalangium rubrum]|uniref:YIP1 family protein n=1 Tax=Hyalangium rubrum TaxID=3103134 RepID=A0ABU5H3T6_9BACT|nr:YIP1 family protein [Hyalangium sp. s54d21]MDY7228125.1 YIP1 family protein [Hyalangium sp. s54d21]